MIQRRSRTRRRPVVVFTEGDNTEPDFIDALKGRQDRLVIKVDDRHSRPRELVPEAVAELKRLRRQHKAEGAPDDESPQVWCVFDRDDHPADRFHQARQRAQSAANQHDRDGLNVPTQRVPSSNVWELVEALDAAY